MSENDDLGVLKFLSRNGNKRISRAGDELIEMIVEQRSQAMIDGVKMALQGFDEALFHPELSPEMAILLAQRYSQKLSQLLEAASEEGNDIFKAMQNMIEDEAEEADENDFVELIHAVGEADGSL